MDEDVFAVLQFGGLDEVQGRKCARGKRGRLTMCHTFRGVGDGTILR